MSLENVIERFCSQDFKEREHNGNARISVNTACSRSSRCSREEASSSQLDSEKSTILRELIKKVSENYGGDDSDFLEQYVKDVVCEWAHDLDRAIICFRELAKLCPAKNRE